MEQLLAKLTNLGYELFGIFIPGIVALIFLLIWWASIGQIAPYISNGFFPQLTSKNASEIIESITVRTGFGIALPIFIITYFLGHMLQWISRSGKASDQILKSPILRTYKSICLQIPKPENSYDARLEPLFAAVQSKFMCDGTYLSWPQFYPIAKNYLSRSSHQSLVTNYQNKYTLHRSITLASAGLFWLCVAGMIAEGIILYNIGVSPRWWLVAPLTLFSVISVWGFSDSYAYNWNFFGNSIITESYSLIYGPKNAESKP